MSRAQRLLDILQVLRNHRFPVTALQLASEFNISTRTLYRDIATLQQQGADIVGEPGLGYVLRPGYTLPPLMFNPQEIAALVLGSRWVTRRADDELATAAHSALSKIAAVLPGDLRSQLELSTLMVGPNAQAPAIDIDVAVLRQAISEQYVIDIEYRDLKGKCSKRRIWPLAVGFFESVQLLVGWCEARADYRHFRLDRITQLQLMPQRYQPARAQLMKEWRERHNIPPQGFGY